MDRTLREHISSLEMRLRELNNQLMDTSTTLVERNRIESESRAAQMAIEHYRKALELERRLVDERETRPHDQK